MLLVALGLLMLLLVGAGIALYAHARWQQAQDLRQWEAEARARGEPWTLAELKSRQPIVPTHQNAALALVALWRHQQPELWDAFLRGETQLPERQPTPVFDLPLVNRNAPSLGRTHRVDPDTLQRMHLHLEERAAHFQEVQAALALPGWSFPQDLSLGLAMPLPQIPAIREEVRWLHLAAVASWESGDTPAAHSALTQIRRFTDHLREDPTLIAQLIRNTFFQVIDREIERRLNHPSFLPEEIEPLTRLLENPNVWLGLRLSLIGERCVALQFLRDPASAAQAMALEDEDSDPESLAQGMTYGMTIWGALGLRTAEELHLANAFGQALRILDEDPPRPLEIQRIFESAYTHSRSFPPKIFSSFTLGAMPKLAPLFAETQAQLLVVRTALAVEQARTATGGSVPESLHTVTALTGYEIPQDPFDDQPLRYRQLPGGYVVYSIGPDGTDDGGIEPPPHRRSRDPMVPHDLTCIVERPSLSE